jgi:hypothetical protein
VAAAHAARILAVRPHHVDGIEIAGTERVEGDLLAEPVQPGAAFLQCADVGDPLRARNAASACEQK